LWFLFFFGSERWFLCSVVSFFPEYLLLLLLLLLLLYISVTVTRLPAS